MKYRVLTEDEFEALKDEFVKFLIVQGIDAASWQKMKDLEPDLAQKYLHDFSDFVFENTLQKIGYIDFFNGNSLKLFKCASDDIQLINIESVSKFETIQDFLKAMASDLTGFTLQRHAKKYHPNRAVELFRMISSGGLVSDGYWYEKLNEMY